MTQRTRNQLSSIARELFLGWPWNWPMKVVAGLLAFNAVVGFWRGEWEHLLYNLSGLCFGRGIAELMGLTSHRRLEEE